jgi:hypothetical protein
MLTNLSPLVSKQFTRIFAAAAILGALSAPAFAQGSMTVPGAPSDMGAQHNYNTQTTDDSATSSAAGSDEAATAVKHSKHAKSGTTPVKYAHGTPPTQEQMQNEVETRIHTLHDKLGITAAQESEWSDVAQAMRSNESSMGSLIQARHTSGATMTAVDDLESYQKIAQAHADGLGKVISAFQTLYEDMSDDQKKNADEVFGKFEGHRGMSKASVKSSSAPKSKSVTH